MRLAENKSLPGTDGNRHLLQAWVRLEAAAKATGEGMAALLARLDVWGRRDAPDLEGTTAAANVRVRDLDMPYGQAAAVGWIDPAGRRLEPAFKMMEFPQNADAIACLLTSGGEHGRTARPWR